MTDDYRIAFHTPCSKPLQQKGKRATENFASKFSNKEAL